MLLQSDAQTTPTRKRSLAYPQTEKHRSSSLPPLITVQTPADTPAWIGLCMAGLLAVSSCMGFCLLPMWQSQQKNAATNATITASLTSIYTQKTVPMPETIPKKYGHLFGYQQDINTAGVVDLAALPKIGEKLAKRIVEKRRSLPQQRFTDWAEIDAVSGVGEKVLLLLQHHFVLQTPANIQNIKNIQNPAEGETMREQQP